MLSIKSDDHSRSLNFLMLKRYQCDRITSTGNNRNYFHMERKDLPQVVMQYELALLRSFDRIHDHLPGFGGVAPA
jgi:hypothetical protein